MIPCPRKSRLDPEMRDVELAFRGRRHERFDGHGPDEHTRRAEPELARDGSDGAGAPARQHRCVVEGADRHHLPVQDADLVVGASEEPFVAFERRLEESERLRSEDVVEGSRTRRVDQRRRGVGLLGSTRTKEQSRMLQRDVRSPKAPVSSRCASPETSVVETAPSSTPARTP